MAYIKNKNSIIQRDHVGLYVLGCNYMARPLYGTIFSEGDEVRTQHCVNSTYRVGLKDTKLKDNEYLFEFWMMQYISQHAYLNRIIDELYAKMYPNPTFDDYVIHSYKESLLRYDHRYVQYNENIHVHLNKYLRADKLEKILTSNLLT